ncbi:hypothetical protein OEZ86_003068 [Tetradesmus obliquus]|nr:hypothetical protein OEZ86_003068 [Tetradesmus obliquus]
MSTVRVVRPRPLGVNDRIPVFWAGQEPSQELKAVDGGALYRHLVASSTPTTNRKRKRTQKYHAPKEGEAHEHFSPLRRAAEQKGPSSPIHIPRVREVEDYALNQAAAATFGPMISGDIAAAPYIRHKELLPGMYEEHQVPEYDADDKDMAWLHNVNTKNGQNNGLFAAAVGLYHQVAQRIARTSSDAAAATPTAPVELRLSLDTFEKAINMLELMHFDAVKAWWEEQQGGPSTSAPQIPEVPAMKRLLPRAVALEGLTGLVPDPKLALQLLEYWLRRRQQEGGPLLARLWFEQPWKLVAFAEFVVSDDEDFDEHLPFMAVEPRSAHGKSRRGGASRRRAISEEDALDALCGLRNELEVLRTLADQAHQQLRALVQQAPQQ